MGSTKLYGDDTFPGQLQCQPSAGDQGPVAGVWGRVGKSGKSGISHGKGAGHAVVNLKSVAPPTLVGA